MSIRKCCGTDEHKPHLIGCRKRLVESLSVISLGIGTQSSGLLAKTEDGSLEPRSFAVVADTGNEPDAVYAWLSKLRGWAKTKIIVASRGNLMEDVLAALKNGKRATTLPYHTKDPVTGERGILPRQCTFDYKISVVQKAIKQALGYKPRQRVTKHRVNLLLGMSLEEVGRMRDSREKWITNKYPLITDVPMHRQQTIEYVESLGLGTPPRSSCIMCPFHSDKEWKHLKENEPHNFEKCVEFDRAIRKQPKLRHECFLHHSLKPLDEVDFNSESPQLDMFQNDCSGMCGA